MAANRQRSESHRNGSSEARATTRPSAAAESAMHQLRKRRISSTWILNLFIVLLVVPVAYFSYAFITRHLGDAAVESEKPVSSEGKTIQLDVLNGCGVSGVASTFTSYLRHRGFDVVEMKNYTSFDVKETLVIDRVGNLTTAQLVARALGVKEENVVQQLNPHYFVDVTVVVGKDFAELKPHQ